MADVLSILAGIILIGIMIIVHELGHFLIGRSLGIPILEFAIGMGPKLYRKQKGETLYTVRLLPIGGFCKFLGEDEEHPDPRAINNQKIWKRALTILAGPVFNIAFAFLIAISTIWGMGDYQSVIDSTVPGSPAAEAGFQRGDIITRINGQDVVFYFETTALIQERKTDIVTIDVLRGDKTVTITSGYFYNEKTQSYMIGINLDYVRRNFNMFEAIAHSGRWIWHLFTQMIQTLIQLVTFTLPMANVLGPVGIIGVMGQAVRSSLEIALYLVILVTLNLGVFNLVPFPALDGGRLVMLAIEKIRGKPIPREKEAMINFIGFVVLIGFILFVSWNDVSKLING